MTVWPVFLASVVGSPHCAAMCGLIAGAAGRSTAQRLAYHAARLIGYVALGLGAGLVGATADRLGLWAGVVGAASRGAGIALVLLGLVTLLSTLGIRILPRSSHRWIGPIAERARALPPTGRAAFLGLATAFLPCGWLWAFVAVAAGTGHIDNAALAMSVFWVGTVPAVASAGRLIERLSGPMRARLPALTAAILIGFGLITAFARPVSHHPVGPDVATHVHRAR